MPERTPTVLVVGGGAAGRACAQELRRGGLAGSIQIVDAEPGGAIDRTLVDKALLPGLLTREQIALPPVEGVVVTSGEAITADFGTKTVELRDGGRLTADAVVIASGAVPRHPDGIDVAPGVPLHRLHTADDVEALRESIPQAVGRRVAVIGAGFSGTELASHYVAAGAEVVLVGRSDMPLAAALGAEISPRLAALLRERTDLRLGTTVQAIASCGARARLSLSDGSSVEVDAVILAHGSIPATAWTGSPDGIRVDDRLRMSERGWYAAGSAAYIASGGTRLTTDHWNAAIAQGEHAARTILHDFLGVEDPGPYRPTTGFNLRAFGSTISVRGLRLPDGSERAATWPGEPPHPEAVLTEFVNAHGAVTGVAGFNAGPALAQAALSIV
ncbi:NAD(P)/FAD-dependent oxidoreductase [Sinomonas sp. JGH33]|uniref:NAD(P)/FAD-dependent oxidoreductase n=1 Tax=Sinomonas terricola TaxID=3110330 RepID=A0ABU5T4W6_9MICC|nr:NAD(P)/FAD-dependent oxidoreductase [Sinomonas sp. JGH33]MEA5454710.1 NAD(P)/FAD-dependent oxidoreductase [Sinomonas sp. JGH33]